MKKLFVSIYLTVLVGIMMLTVTSCDGSLEDRSMTVTDDFIGIEIRVSTVDVTVLPSIDGECRVVSKSHKKISYTAAVDGGVLAVRECDERSWIERVIGSSDSSTRVREMYV